MQNYILAAFQARAQVAQLQGQLRRHGLEPEDPRDLLAGWNRNLFMTLEEVELSVRAQNCLVRNAGLDLVYEVAEKTDKELLAIKDLGQKTLDEIHQSFRGLGLTTGMQLLNFPRLR